MLKSVIWSSMLDYPGHLCTSLFFDGCNFACEYCQNKDISKAESINFDKDVLPQLLERKEFVKHIILSGGECTIDPKIQEIVDILYNNEFKIGLHTNGYNTEFLEKNINKISYVGMDIKNSLDKYDEISARKINIEKIKKSIDLIIRNLDTYEFRTTVYPKFVNEEDCINIAKYLGERNAKNYTIQQYKKVDGLEVIPFSNEKMQNIQKRCSEYVKTELRGLIK